VQRFYDNQSVTLADALFSRLVRADPRNASRLLPVLAVAVPKPTNGGRTYTYKLRARRP
jgi:ABC-type transport system substrate-binding protein